MLFSGKGTSPILYTDETLAFNQSEGNFSKSMERWKMFVKAGASILGQV